jgi:type I restriction enzyme S subunit
VKPLFACTETGCVKNDDGKENNVLSLSYGRIVRRDVDQNFGLLPESFNTYQLIRAGDVILRLTDLQNDKRSLRVGHVQETGIITSAYLKLAAKEGQYHDRYLYLLLHSYDTTKVFYGMGGGLRQSMKFDDMRRLPMLVPSLDEQAQIANFLDHETAKIDTLIDKQQQLIKLLKEKRQAVISHAVTKGLNPDAPMKDSGVEWLGEVPEHWKVGKSGFYLSILSGFAFTSTGFTEDESDTRLLRGINVGVSRLKWEESAYWQRSLNDGLDIYEMRVGDLVMGMDRPLISAGIRVAKVEEKDLPCLLLQRVIKIKTWELLKADYLLGLLSSNMFVAHFSPDTTGVSVPHISPEQVRNFIIPVPPAEEQNDIITFLQKQTYKLDGLTEKAEGVITLLQERRTALISAAVTGKIDVRNWQPAQPKIPMEASA